MKFGSSINNYFYSEVNFYESTAFNMYNFVGYAAFSLFFAINVMKLETIAEKSKIKTE